MNIFRDTLRPWNEKPRKIRQTREGGGDKYTKKKEKKRSRKPVARRVLRRSAVPK